MDHPSYQSLSPFYFLALYVAVVILGLDRKIGNISVYLKHYKSWTEIISTLLVIFLNVAEVFELHQKSFCQLLIKFSVNLLG